MSFARRRNLRPDAPPGAKPKPITVALAAALLAGAPAAAMTLGELVLDSGIGQPLRARVAVALQPGEGLAANCVSLERPPGDAAGQYLTRAALDVTGNGREIHIATPYAIEAPVLYLRLKAGCGAAALTRDYTALLDPPGARPAPPPAASAPAAPRQRPAPPPPAAGWELRPGDTARSIAAAIYPGAPALQERLARAIVGANPQAFPHGSIDQPASGASMLMPDLRDVGVPPAAAARPVRAPAPPKPEAPPAAPVARSPKPETPPAPPPAPLASAKPEAPPAPPPPAARSADRVLPVLRLKLSAAELDLSRASRVSADERALLREAQQLMEAGDQTARYLQLRQQVVQLEAQLEELRRRAARPAPSAPAPAPAAAPLPAAPAPAPGTDLTVPALAAGLGALLLAALYAAARRWRGRPVAPATASAAMAIPAPAAEPPPASPPPAPAPPAVAPEPAPRAPEPPQAARSVDAVLEEAQLYMIHGRPLRAIKLLEEQIAGNQGEIRLWMLLFVILRSQKLKEEFSALALRFRATEPDPELWQNIQSLGHELDPDNPLYAGAAAPAVPAAAPGRARTADAGTLELELPGEDAPLPTLDLQLDQGAADGRPGPENPAAGAAGERN